MREFSAAVAEINALAERSPGFVWRYPAADGHLNGAELTGDPLVLINLSVWAGYQYLHEFTYRSRHGHFLRRRAQWFVAMPPPTTALWWTPAGRPPSPEHGLARLDHLRRYGPAPQAFTLRRRFRPDGSPERRQPRDGKRSGGNLSTLG